VSSRFVQLLSYAPTPASNARLIALDDDGTIWIWGQQAGWRKWTEQREAGVNLPATT
jgi:hypothetical protein